MRTVFTISKVQNIAFLAKDYEDFPQKLNCSAQIEPNLVKIAWEWRKLKVEIEKLVSLITD